MVIVFNATIFLSNPLLMPESLENMFLTARGIDVHCRQGTTAEPLGRARPSM
jgi:hypothetical protein